MYRIATRGSACVALIFSMLLSSWAAYSQTNLALTAVAAHSGGGAVATGYGPALYNDNQIPVYNIMGTFQWGWVTTGGWIEFTWPTPQMVAKVKLYKNHRQMGSCTLQYWNGTTYVNIMSYSNPSNTNQIDSIQFIPVSTKLGYQTCSPSLVQ